MEEGTGTLAQSRPAAPTAGDQRSAGGLPVALRHALWVLLVAFSIAGVFDHGLWAPNDTREGGMIWDMYQSGTWVTPTVNGKPYLEKPPLLHWTALLGCHLVGRVLPGLLRLPAALYGFGTLLLLYLLVRRREPPDGTEGDATTGEIKFRLRRLVREMREK